MRILDHRLRHEEDSVLLLGRDRKKKEMATVMDMIMDMDIRMDMVMARI